MLSTLVPHFPPRDWSTVPDAELPTTDPHGVPWSELSSRELLERASWCMRLDSHEALRRARRDRVAEIKRADPVRWSR